ncbi:DUF2507 domain-containing protein [Oceanobacillus halotolerans]|uniref:DUF2507 domain-containing protein n=1 Tax=Oceanobacillus halotolerans TaxID=2663380 RepID=UPI0013DD84A9|nr:DUF2507 domain-containing protein [Oceanobacillus halotolerans]
MQKKTEELLMTDLDQLHTSGAGYDVLRYISLPELLGKESDTLLYFLGKSLARKFNPQSLDDIILLFEKLGWGKLEIRKKKRKTVIFQLMADAVVQRINSSLDVEFRLESGFLAEAMEILNGKSCECTEEINRKLYLIEFNLIFTD